MYIMPLHKDYGFFLYSKINRKIICRRSRCYDVNNEWVIPRELAKWIYIHVYFTKNKINTFFFEKKKNPILNY